ncbi:hypothetical protein BXZ70DRAFT_4127 [Cristinia sonorae]|uniref:DUF6593 domain-containing protein n=1 Tax=Cristinia sonorae TaxID=1940300 RepID=A0A8K0UXK6_9AGAR|nr:hypothetical protein BXZ70DRAFT_4127 [Cristinia sonorae]
MSAFGLPLYLIDKTPNNLTDSEFTDMYERVRMRVHCTLRNADRTVVMVYKSGVMAPLACLEYGAGNALGTIQVNGKAAVPMNDYLIRVTKGSRKFVASDGQTYTWKYTPDAEEVWQCLNPRSYSVATYGSSGASSNSHNLTIEEGWIHLTAELLASLVIMRHIVKYNL